MFFAQAVVAADSDIFFSAEAVARLSPDAPEEYCHLLLPFVHHHLPPSGGGEIVLEAVCGSDLASIICCPIGVLTFTCSREERDRMLGQRSFSTKDIQAGRVAIGWATEEQVLSLNAARRGLKKHAPAELARFAPTGRALFKNVFKTNVWVLVGLLDVHAKKLRGGVEKLWLFYQVSMRWDRGLSCDKTTLTKLISSDDDGSSVDLKRLQLFWDIAPDTMRRLEKALEDTLRTRGEILDMTKLTLTEPMQRWRRSLACYPLYASHAIQKFTEESIGTIPETLLDAARMRAWAEERAERLNARFSDDEVFGAQYRDVTPRTRTDAFFHLYGNIGEELAGRYDVTYVRERLGTLTNPRYPPLPLVNGSPRPFINLGHAELRVLEAREFCVPIWAVPEKDNESMHFYRLKPSFSLRAAANKKKRVESFSAVFAECLDVSSRDDLYAHEYLSGGMHWSRLVFDIDFPAAVDEGRLIGDAVELVSTVFRQIFGGADLEAVFVFGSKRRSEEEKIGLHVHARLPPRVVFTSEAVRDFCEILERVRFRYPQTLGLPTEKAVFDVGIYPKRYLKGHCLRLPYQSKRNGGGRRLELRYSSAPPTLWDLFAHAPHHHDGVVSRGDVVERLEGGTDIRDVALGKRLMARAVDNLFSAGCVTDAETICGELNERCVMFRSGVENARYLVRIVNDIWTNTGKDALHRYMRAKEGTDGGEVHSNAATARSGRGPLRLSGRRKGRVYEQRFAVRFLFEETASSARRRREDHRGRRLFEEHDLAAVVRVGLFQNGLFDDLFPARVAQDAAPVYRRLYPRVRDSIPGEQFRVEHDPRSPV